MSAFDELKDYVKQTEALGQVLGRLGWDMECIMPKGSAEQRSEEMAALERVIHARRGDARVGDWLDQAEAGDPAGQALLREVRRAYDRATKVPGDLAAEIARETSRGHHIWAEARANEDVAAFLPTLERIVALRREEAAALAGDGALYDAMLNDYEPETSGADLQAMFDALRPGLVALRDRILGQPVPKALTGAFPQAKQMALSAKLAEVFGYDFDIGRIDLAVHPFSSGSGRDVRITTRTDESDPLGCFYSTIHEVGHAVYEQRIDPAYGLTPLGSGVSMGVHESQSRSFENQMGRSRAFCGWLYKQMTESFGEVAADEDAFYAAVNRVEAGYIRTEADEVHYNLHVLLRFDLERALFDGALEVADLEEAWNTRFEADFGVAVDKPSNGLLQDVHWSAGLFGYFPTYTLGNVYAGCLMEVLRADLPDLDADLTRGNPLPAVDWLTEKLHRHGGLRSPVETITYACGKPPSEAPLLAYLDRKFGALYGL